MDAGVWMRRGKMKMKREYSTWYKSDSDTKRKKKEKNNHCVMIRCHTLWFLVEYIYTQ